MFRQLEYQERVSKILEVYLDLLADKKSRSDKIATLSATQPELGLDIPDFAEDAWNSLKCGGHLPVSRASIPFSERKDGCERPVPNAVLKVPTGGGKTWLAVSSVSRILSRYLNRNTGFVLWIVPNEAIYTQTLKHLRDRQHPYRQRLDRSAAGRVKIMEKADRLEANDVETHLCVMLLMLQAANRETQESLKMFQDRGDVHGFFPPEGEQEAHKAAFGRTPNLTGYNDVFPMVKDSLGNALRIIRPLVVLDEGHRAISDLAFRTLYGFNPCFVLELTATPRDVQPRGGHNPRAGRYANVLVEVTGHELDREGMIKMPLNLDSRQGNDWKTTLNIAVEKLRRLDQDALQFQANTNRYIRPVMLIQAERTGADQREGGYIHADDVKNWLLKAGFDEAEVAIKTAERNDLNQPENQDLLSATNRVRFIITKQALQEGWDCPFAYVLCALAASSNLNAMTQLVGRILRQPGAIKTGLSSLDECYIVTHHADTARAVEAIKHGLERDGLGDLVMQISHDRGSENGSGLRKINRRPRFAKTEIYLPKVITLDDNQARELDYETDVLSNLDWSGFEPGYIAARIPENAQAVERQLQRIRLTDKRSEFFVGEAVSKTTETTAFDPSFVVRMISDIVPNPFVGREIVGKLMKALNKRGFDDNRLGGVGSLIVEELRKALDNERTVRAESLFKVKVTAGHIQFRLRLDSKNWRMPFNVETSEPINSRQLVSRTGGALQKSLFSPVYENELNNDEREVAVYLDAEETLSWWHRNVARTQYGIQGWKKSKIYPDFIFAVNGDSKGKRIVILETKGDQLDNLDTAYKRDLLTFLSDNFKWDDCTTAGELELVQNDGETVQCALVLMSEWKSKLPHYM